ncbi:helix-turn-helix domain-containing protein [Rhodococcus qingshengii]
MHKTIVYLSREQVAERIGVHSGALSRYKLPPPDAVIGHLNEDGSVPRGSFRGWLPKSIDEWNANRPGRGTRTDLAK